MIIQLDGEGITGNLHIPHSDPKSGIVLGTGILGNRYGLDNLAQYLTKQGIAAITLDPPSHHRNIDEFSFGNYAKQQLSSARFLRDAGVEIVVGGGHSGGPIAGIYAALGINHDLELRLHKAENLISSQENIFDGLIIASMPYKIRKFAPGYIFNKPMLKLVNSLFHQQNRTKKENITKYINSRMPYEWKHFHTEDLFRIKEYSRSIISPHELIDRVDKETEANLIRMPKCVLVGQKDAFTFGRLATIGLSKKRIMQYREMISGLGEHEYHDFDSGHFLNKEGTEIDSLWGLKLPLVQETIYNFIKSLE